MSLRALYDVPAPAKLNVFLHVVGRRADGYHLLQSLMVPIDWSDTLHFERRDDGRLVRHDLGDPLPADDLCLRAARALRQASATPLGADVSIVKRLPSGAGMGGGSSDAATTLIALNRLWQLDWPRDRLAALGLSIGADVPFFLGRGAAFVEGIGERLTPVDFAPTRFAVVKPAASVETRAVFASPFLVRNTAPLSDADILAGLSAGGLRATWATFQATRNDLQGPAERLCADVARAAEGLAERFGNSRMTGSGSAVFAVVDETGAADLPGGLPAGWTARMCTSLAVHPLADWVRG